MAHSLPWGLVIIRDIAGTDTGYASVVVLPTHPASVTLGRNVVLAWFTFAPADYHVDTTLLLVTELLSDAMAHAEGALLFSVASRGSELRVELAHAAATSGATADLLRTYDDSRHLRLVSALADRWGLELRLTEDGQPQRVAWFECDPIVAGEEQQVAQAIPRPRRISRS